MRLPPGQHVIEALLLRVRRVGDRGDVARRRRGPAEPRDRRGRRAERSAILTVDGDRNDERLRVPRRRLGERARRDGDEQRGGGEPAALERPLPEAVAAGPVRRGRRVVADRPGARPQQRGRDRVVEDRPRRVLGDARDGGGSRRASPREIGQHERAHLARGLRGGHRDVRAGAAQRARELLHVGAQPRRRTERDDEDVGRGHPCLASSRIAWLTQRFTSRRRSPPCPRRARSSTSPRSSRARRSASPWAGGCRPVCSSACSPASGS